MAWTQLKKHLHRARCCVCPGSQSPRSALETGAGGASGGRDMSQPLEVSLLVWWDLSSSNPTFASKREIPLFKKRQHTSDTSVHPHNQTIAFCRKFTDFALVTGGRWTISLLGTVLFPLQPLCAQSDKRLFFSCGSSLPTSQTLT